MTKRFLETNIQDQQSLRAKVFNCIREDILNGKYKQGDSLVENKLAEEFGVSRTPVREAIRQLELEGLVQSIPNKGVIVKGISKQDINDIYTIKKLLEGQAARWAVERMLPEELKKLQEIVELMDYYTRKSDFEQLAKLDTEFHDIIYKACKSKVMQHILSSFHHYVQRERLGSLRVPHRAIDSLTEHQAILKSFVDHDPDEAEKYMVQHVLHAGMNVLSCEKKEMEKRKPVKFFE